MLYLGDFARYGLLLLMIWISTSSALARAQRKSEELSSILRDAFPSVLQDPILTPDITAFQESIAAKTCDPTMRYRSIDGSCNNLDHPEYGTPLQPFVRLIGQAYDDGKCKPHLFRGEKSTLPSPRAVSLACVLPSSDHTAHNRLLQTFRQWGQFVDHDITLAPEIPGRKSCEGIRDDGTHPDYDTCGPKFPIKIPAGDRVFKTECMEFFRSAFVEDSNGVRQQFNSLTAYIDASHIYGSSAERLKKLRDTTGGCLKMQSDFLPIEKTSHRCVLQAPASGCFLAGDTRVVTNPGLAAFHTIFAREHNQIARKLAKINPKWNNERLFQEARRIVGAYMQHITYSTWLPLLLGKTTMKSFGLLEPYWYDKDENPNVINSFSAAAFRMGHSMVSESTPAFSDKNMKLHQMFFRPHLQIEGNGKGIDAVTSGLLNTKLQKIDRFFTTSLTDLLFQDVDSPGEHLDLFSLNVQRARDHGIPAYKRFKEYCAQFQKGIYVKPLDHSCQSVYRNEDDVDLFVGGVSEDPIPGSLVGPTFACIIALQFQKLRNGDRFFYETQDKTIGFTSEQLTEIKKVTLSRIICDHTGIDEIHPDAFSGGHCHKKKKCCDLPEVDLSPWREKLYR